MELTRGREEVEEGSLRDCERVGGGEVWLLLSLLA